MSRLLAAATILFVLAAPAASAEWDSVYLPPLGTGGYAPTVFSESNAGGLWAAGIQATAAPPSEPVVVPNSVLVHYDANGSATARRPVEGQLQSAVALPDGGLVALAYLGFPGQCHLRGFDATGGLRWDVPAPPSEAGAFTPACPRLSVDGASGSWVVLDDFSDNAKRVVRYRADGIQTLAVATRRADGELLTDIVADPTQAAAYLAGTTGASPFLESGRAAIARVDSAGATAWRWVDDIAGLSHPLEITFTSDGSVFATGTTSVGEDARLFAVRLARDGTVQHLERSLDLVSPIDEFGGTARPYSLRAGSDGSAYVLAHRIGDALGAQRLVRFGATGTIHWSIALDGWTCACTSAATPDGGIALLLAHDGQQVIRRFTAGGQSHDEPLPVGVPYYDVQRLLAVGELVPLDTAVPAYRGRRFVASTHDAEGNTYLVSAGPGERRLDKIAADGSLLWSQPYSSFQIFADVRVDAGSVCVVDSAPYFSAASTLHVLCVDPSTGGNRLEFERDASITSAAIVALRAGALPLVSGTYAPISGFSAFLVVDLAHPDDEPLLSYEDFQFPCQVHDASGRTLILGYDEALVSATATLIDPDGSLRYARTAVAGFQCNGSGEHARLLPDGSALLFGQTDDVYPGASKATRLVQLLRPDGETQWTKSLGASESWIWSAADSDFVYLSLLDEEDEAPDRARVVALSIADGTELWRRDISARTLDAPRVFVEASSKRVLYVDSGVGDVRFKAIDGDSGAITGSMSRGCGAPCYVAAAELDASGRLRLGAFLDPVAGLGSSALFRVDHPFDVAIPYARADQAALDGVWYTPSTTGQGLVLDYIDAAHTAFLSWFTFTPAGGLAPGEQRWYTLQGGVSADAGTVNLGIFENTGGRFAGPPATSAQRVGAARLVFPACGTAVLDYAFDAAVNDGAHGTLTLSPITPPGASCAPVGSVPVGPPANSGYGFDLRQSGTWYDPSSGGQGFSFAVRPGASPGTGYVFGAWYTYDPEGQADDPTAQHWFTLQGGLAGATDGTVTLTISRTIGGSFDYDPTRDTLRVGTATLHFSSCGSATLDYQFDSSEVAAAFAGLSGHLNLTGLGTCP